MIHLLLRRTALLAAFAVLTIPLGAPEALAQSCSGTTDCITVELLSFSTTDGETTFNWKITTDCDHGISYVAFELPAGVTPLSPPAGGGTYTNGLITWDVEYTGTSGRPGYHSIKFEGPTDDDIKNGDMVEFSYTVPDGPGVLDPIRVQVKYSTTTSTVIIDPNECPPGGVCEDDVTVTFVPNTTTVPSAGGTVDFDLTVTNNGTGTCFADCLVIVKRPRNREVFRDTLISGNLGPGGSITDTYTLDFPATAPDGLYKVIFFAGVFATNTIYDRARVDITKGGLLHAPLASASATGASASPNPFAGKTHIAFTTEAAADVRLAVYDLLGREVAVLVDDVLEAGAHRAAFQANDLAAGTYVYRLSVGSDVQTGRITLIR